MGSLITKTRHEHACLYGKRCSSSTLGARSSLNFSARVPKKLALRARSMLENVTGLCCYLMQLRTDRLRAAPACGLEQPADHDALLRLALQQFRRQARLALLERNRQTEPVSRTLFPYSRM